MENAIPIPQGGAEKRPGTRYIAEVKTSSLKTRLLPFEFSTSQSYIIELGNQYARFYTDSAVIFKPYGTEDLSALSANLVAHWKCNDNAASTAVDDDVGSVPHDGVAEDNTDTYSTTDESGTANKAFNLNGTDEFVTVSDHAALSFGDGTDDSPFSLHAWVNYTSDGTSQGIISKYVPVGGLREWALLFTATDKIRFQVFDDTTDKVAQADTIDTVSDGWHFIVATYGGLGGNLAAGSMKVYVDWVEWDVNQTNDAAYVAMDDLGGAVEIGRFDSANPLGGDIHNVAIFDKELTQAEVVALTGTNSTTSYEIEAPYLTADLFELKFKQSADVLYITHPDYETRKLSRLGNAAWKLEPIGIGTGPFRGQNIDAEAKIAADGTTGSVTLTATNGTPFVTGTTAGHSPSGVEATSKAWTGALFRLVHPLDTLEYSGAFTAANDNDQYSTLYDDATWTLVSGGTWRGKFEIQRNYTIGAAWDADGWETVFPFTSGTADGTGAERNVSTTGTHTGEPADYQAVFITDWGGQLDIFFSTDQTEHVGIVEITAVTSSTSATGTVVRTLASTDATHKWSEGSWSNYRGWPGTVAFFEDRLMFGGNTNQPDTIWGSVTGDYENMIAGANDDDAVVFTLSSRQVNVIEWLVGKDKLLIGTSGAEWTIAGGTDEPLTPSNVIAKQHSTYGSANLQATLANESVLFFQRGAEKMRELAYNWELDSYVAPDMTILANLVTNTGITDTAFQRTPNSILWTTRTDGELPIFSYERAENITAWSRMITQTNLAGTLTDSDIESVAVINGSPEDEVWAIVERIIDSNTVRYIEQFQPRDFGDSTDAIFVDCGITYDSVTASSAMTGLGHLEGQTVYVLADGVQFDTEVVAGGAITLSLDDITTTAFTVQMGLGYEVQLRTMPLSWVEGQTIQGKQKKISEVISRWYKSGDFSIGRDADNLQTYSITNQTTSIDRKTFSPGWTRNGYIFVYQLSPEPLTLLSIMAEFNLR